MNIPQHKKMYGYVAQIHRGKMHPTIQNRKNILPNNKVFINPLEFSGRGYMSR